MKLNSIISIIFKIFIGACLSYSIFWLFTLDFENLELLHNGPVGIIVFSISVSVVLILFLYLIYNIFIVKHIVNKFNNLIRTGFKYDDIAFFEKRKKSLFFIPARSLIYYCLSTIYLVTNQINKAEENLKILLFNFHQKTPLPYIHLASAQLWTIASVKEDEDLYKKCLEKFYSTKLTGRINVRNRNLSFQKVEDAGDALKLGNVRSAIDLLELKQIPFFKEYYEKGIEKINEEQLNGSDKKI